MSDLFGTGPAWGAARYPTVDELDSAAHALARRRPDVCRLRRVGASRHGRPLRMLSIGHGSRHALVVAGAHCNEPVGRATLLRLAERLLTDDGPHGGADVTWHLLLCLDPDGARLNEPMGDTPFALTDPYRNFFRPVAAEQPELFHAGPRAGTPLPETRALTGVIDELRPFVQLTLHGVDIGGSFVQLTRAVPGIAEPFAKSAAEFQIPVELGPYDAFYWTEAGPGVYLMPRPGSREGFAGLPDEVVRSTWYYPHRYGGLTAVVEVPMWAAVDVADDRPHPDPDRALREAAGALHQRVGRVAALLDRARPFLPGEPDPLLRAARFILRVAPVVAEDWEDIARRRPHDPTIPPMTVARVRSLEIAARRAGLRTSAMLSRLLRRCEQRSAVRLGEELDALVGQWCEECRTLFRPRWIPIGHQAEHQARTVLATVERLS
ncbi:M14 family zinc carboxypeptidase [Allostreptomyces psammosilenae]|uniref:Peptidase M14 domain-containing protein n=1 Tax=Allostreptomyces psammosilenae TaxID=1892865 RepID=A0A852ZU47_9ACTN|nr:M14 family zinc carboxypeptidase [Allostreptomyces psammosilenae]NYI04294.1 hypothetical protein [Allostreptomyces psammosilenae]